VQKHYENELMYLLHKIYRVKHFDCSKYKLTTLTRRLERRLFATGCNNYYEYAYYLDKHPEEYDTFLNDLTINVTHFFRDRNVFDFLKQNILPEVIAQKQGTTTKRIRIWSAGCAGGEETYSLAIMLSELLGSGLADFSISLWGTDVDKKSLDEARKGEYDKEMVKSMPAVFLNKYFDFDGVYRVKDSIKNMVRFRRHDLISDKPMKCFDVITCRNTLIYFNREFQSKLFDDFYNGLNRHGFLVLGKSEMPSQEILPKIECVSKRNCVYRKIEVK
jgi:two-component system, chemotaxis family, CheB/CheR fusion protein